MIQDRKKTKIKALSLFSGGLDSILAARIVMAQGVEVEAVQFITPFFDYPLLTDIEGYKREVEQKYDLTVHLEDISDAYLQMLSQPPHGFGRYFNPCIDCKIMMIRKAKELLVERGASFLISGEVLGQRPMSQRRDTLNVIGRDSEIDALLLRPLSARLMEESEAERRGWVKRSELYAMSGRGRSAQIALAEELGITDYPAPAGGCILADPILSRRIRSVYHDGIPAAKERVNAADMCCLLLGRQIILPSGGWLVIGRDERENIRLEELCQTGDVLFYMEEWPGPSALLKKRQCPCYDGEEGRDLFRHDMEIAAGMVVYYAKKIPSDDMRQSRTVYCRINGEQRVFDVPAGDCSMFCRL